MLFPFSKNYQFTNTKNLIRKYKWRKVGIFVHIILEFGIIFSFFTPRCLFRIKFVKGKIFCIHQIIVFHVLFTTRTCPNRKGVFLESQPPTSYLHLPPHRPTSGLRGKKALRGGVEVPLTLLLKINQNYYIRIKKTLAFGAPYIIFQKMNKKSSPPPN